MGLGLAALAAGLGLLEAGFVRERASARENLRARRATLEQYAAAAVRDTLHRALEEAHGRIERAREDPLAPAEGLLLVEGGDQVLPRVATHRSDAGPSGQALADAVRDGTVSVSRDDSPWTQRLHLADALRRSILRNEVQGIPAAFRTLLSHRARFVIEAARDLPLMIGVLELFVAHETPERLFIQGLLRDGLVDSHATSLEGLQPALLRARSAFSDADFQALAARLVAIAAASHVRKDDFEERVLDVPFPPLDLSGAQPPTLLRGWYIEADGRVSSLRGVHVKLNELLDRTTQEMRERGLLGPDETVSIEGTPPPQLVMDQLRPVVRSSLWETSEWELDRAFRLKTGLIALCGTLALGIVVFAWLDQARRRRYLQLKSDFVAAVSHELKTPLASLRVMTETLQNRVAGIPGTRDYPARMLREIDRLVILVENILSFNRLEKDRWVPRLQDITLAQALPAIETELACFSRAKVRLLAEGLDEATIRADPEMLQLLFANLTRNACQYNTRDPVEIRVNASRTDRLRVQFSDNGVGIAPEDRARIFGEFYRGASSAVVTHGSGLGLAVCRRIMLLHQGSIAVAASGTNGTTFELLFP
jgi:signal transduction histidine kinase